MTVLSVFRYRFAIYAFLSVVISLTEYLNAWIMKAALTTLKEQPQDVTFIEKLQGVGKLVFALVASKLLLTIVSSNNQFHIEIASNKITNSINGLIFNKIKQKSLERDKLFSLGEITNLSQVDSNQISNIGSSLSRLIIVPIEIIIGVGWLFQMFGLALFPAMGVLFFVTTLNYYLSKLYMKYKIKLMEAKDQRGQIISEVFNNIKFIKISGLENFFLSRILISKENELYWRNKFVDRSLASVVINNAGPMAFLITLFTVYMWMGNSLDVPLIFTSMQIFNLFKRNFSYVPYLLVNIADLMVSSTRISLFLMSEEIDYSHITYHDKESETPNSIEIKHGNFYWNDLVKDRLYKREKDRIYKKVKKQADKKKDDNDPKSNDPNTKGDDKNQLEIDKQQSIQNRQKSDREGSESILTQSNDIRESLISHPYSDGGDDESMDYGLKKDTLGELKKQASLDTRREDIVLNLKDIDMTIKQGQLVAVVGKIGCGKSSLLRALLGELYPLPGTKIELKGQVSYVAQRNWIESKTIRENIIFGEVYDEDRYINSVKYSGLEDDLKILSKGDDTFLGDSGVNLSGGQKLRVALARAFYSNQDIYLLDDPISSLDINVGTMVMEKGIVDFLKGKTRIVTTHALPYLKFFDYIYILDQGRIVERGTYEEIQKTETFNQLRSTLEEEEDSDDEENSLDQSLDLSALLEDNKPEDIGPLLLKKKSSIEKRKSTGRKSTGRRKRKSKKQEKEADQNTTQELLLDGIKDEKVKAIVEDIVQEEDREVGSVGLQVYLSYLKLTGGVVVFLLLMGLYTCWCLLDFASLWFLQAWVQLPKETQSNVLLFMAYYGSLSILTTFIVLCRNLVVFKNNIVLSRELNFEMSFRLIHASMNQFFDRVPLGRILNRFLKDSSVVDAQVPWKVIFFFYAL